MGGELLGMALAGGTLNPIAPNASREEQIAAINDIIARLNAQLKTQTFSDDNSKRWLNGYQKDGWAGGDFGMKISAPGYDVTDLDAVLLYSWDYTTNIQIVYTDGVPSVLTGAAPDDGRGGIWVADPGQDVYELLGG